MERITLSDLKEVCCERGIKQYFFYASDGSERDMDRTIIMESYFTHMEVVCVPDVLIFSKESDTLQLLRVKEIQMLDCGTCGVVFDVVCGNRNNTGEDKKYHFSAI